LKSKVERKETTKLTRLAVLLVRFIATVEIAITLFVRWNTDSTTTSVVTILTGAIGTAICVSFVGSVDAVHYLVTLPMFGNAVGLVKDILSTGKLI